MAAMAQTAKTNSPKLDMKMAITQSALWDEMNNSPSLKDCRDADWPDTFACNFMASGYSTDRTRVLGERSRKTRVRTKIEAQGRAVDRR